MTLHMLLQLAILFPFIAPGTFGTSPVAIPDQTGETAGTTFVTIDDEVFALVEVSNGTDTAIDYSLKPAGGNWTQFRLEAHSSQWHARKLGVREVAEDQQLLLRHDSRTDSSTRYKTYRLRPKAAEFKDFGLGSLYQFEREENGQIVLFDMN